MTSGGNSFIRPASGFGQRHRRASFSGLNAASERRRGDLVRAQNTEGTTHVIPGFRELLGAGESLVDVKFPVAFIQMPVFVYGAALAPGSELIDGSYPVVSAVVAYWDVSQPDKESNNSVSRQYFTGAQVAVTTSGPETQRLIMNWQFSGLALTNPVGSQRTIPGTGETGRIIS